MLSFLLISISSVPLSRISAIIAQTNSTLKGSSLITGEFNRSPLLSNVIRSDAGSLHLTRFNFFKMSAPVFSATTNMELTISKTTFKNSLSPIRVSGVDRAKLKPFTQRKARSNMQLTLRDVLFDFCNSPTEEGGSLFCDNCQVSISDVEFVSSVASIGGGLFAKSSRLSMQSVSFFKCSARKEGGGFYARGCTLLMSKCYVVANKADGKYGGFYQSGGSVRLYENYIYENYAKLGYGGASFEQSTGELNQNKFVDNRSPLELGGTALYVISTTDFFMVEYCTFGGTQKYYIKYASNTGVKISESCFELSQELCYSVEGTIQGTKQEEMPQWYNNHFFGQCPPPPKLPPRFYKELFYHRESAPIIEWWKLYAGLGIFILLLTIMVFSVPSIFFPLVVKGAQRRGDSINTA